MTNLSCRNHIYHTALQPQACPENRHYAYLAGISQLLAYALRHWSFNLHILQRKISGDFVGHQHADFLQQLTKILGSCSLFTHHGQLVLNQWMVNNIYFQIRHHILLLPLVGNYS